jgi:hypothetical protein
MRTNAFYEISGQLESALIREQEIKDEIKELTDILKDNGGCTVLEARAAKRILKAKAKGPDALEKLAEKMDADSAIFDDLAHTNLAYKKVVRVEADLSPQKEHKQVTVKVDEETGEITETELVAGADSHGSSHQSRESEARDSAPINPRLATIIDEPFARDATEPTRPDDILGDEPIPAFLDKRSA